MDANKKPRMKKEQQQHLLNSLMRNPEMVNGNSQLPSTKRLWADLTEALNGMGGVRKTQKDWLETYKLLARRAKAKMRTHRASLHRTGGGPPIDVILTDLEKKTLTIEGTSTVYGLPGAVEAGIVIIPASQPITISPAPDVEQDIVIGPILTAADIEPQDTKEELPREAAMADASMADVSTPTASYDWASVVGRAETTQAAIIPAANGRDDGVGTAGERGSEAGMLHGTPRRARDPRRPRPRTLVPPADTAAPQDAMIAALREGAQAQMALANAQLKAAEHLGECIVRAATMVVEAMELYCRNKNNK